MVDCLVLINIISIHRSIPLVNVTVNFDEVEDIGVDVPEPRYRKCTSQYADNYVQGIRILS